MAPVFDELSCYSQSLLEGCVALCVVCHPSKRVHTLDYTDIMSEPSMLSAKQNKKDSV